MRNFDFPDKNDPFTEPDGLPPSQLQDPNQAFYPEKPFAVQSSQLALNYRSNPMVL
jgi:hypothetical protein